MLALNRSLSYFTSGLMPIAREPKVISIMQKICIFPRFFVKKCESDKKEKSAFVITSKDLNSVLRKEKEFLQSTLKKMENPIPKKRENEDIILPSPNVGC